MTAGTFNVARSIWKHEAFAPEPFTEREAFMWMVGEASWKPRKKRVGDYVVDIDRGQLASSIRFLAAAWRWKKDKVSRFLLRCKKHDMLETNIATGVTIITICNYEVYQNTPSNSATDARQQARQDRDRCATNENKDEIKKDTPLPPKGDDPALDLQSKSPTPEDLYNIAAEAKGWPKARALNSASQKKLKARIKELGGIEGWKDMLRTAGKSPHLCGKNDRGWTVSLPWLLSPTNCEKVVNGSYLANGAREEFQRSRGQGPISIVDQIMRERG